MTDQPIIKWQDPPPPLHGGGGLRTRTEARRAALRQRPGQWGLVRQGVGYSSGSNSLRVSLGDGFEVTGRSCGDGTWDLYARYVGGESA